MVGKEFTLISIVKLGLFINIYICLCLMMTLIDDRLELFDPVDVANMKGTPCVDTLINNNAIDIGQKG